MIFNLKNRFGRKTRCLNRDEYEFRNMLTVSQMIIKLALRRQESRGAHYRVDYQFTYDKGLHNCIVRGQGEPSFA